jgi:hypothetical protein
MGRPRPIDKRFLAHIRRTTRFGFHDMLADDAEGREEYMAGDSYTGSLIVVRV